MKTVDELIEEMEEFRGKQILIYDGFGRRQDPIVRESRFLGTDLETEDDRNIAVLTFEDTGPTP